MTPPLPVRSCPSSCPEPALAISPPHHPARRDRGVRLPFSHQPPLRPNPAPGADRLVSGRRHSTACLLSACIFLTGVGRAEVLFHDDFSSPAAGNPPLASNWTRPGGGSALIRDQSLHPGFGSPQQFLRFSGTTISCIVKTPIPLSGVVTVQFEFYEPSGFHNPGERFIFGFGRNNELNTSNAGLAFSLRDGTVAPTSGSGGPTAFYALDHRQAATVIFNRSGSAVTYPLNEAWHSLPDGSADLWLSDGVAPAPTKIGTYTSSANGPAANQFLFRVFSNSPGNTMDIDRVVIHDTMQLPGWVNSWRSRYFPHTWQPPVNNGNYDFHQSAFLQDFSYAGYRLRATGFPSTSLTSTSLPVHDVTKHPFYADKTGGTDVTAKIQEAITKAGNEGGGLVYLPSGTYRVSPQGGNNYALRISKSKVVLRGASAGSTFIFNSDNSMRSKHVIRIDGPEAAEHLHAGSGTSAITADLVGPATIIPVADPSLFSVGNWVTLRSDAGTDWVNEHGESSWVGQESALGGLAYRRRITAVDANSITIDVPTRYAMKMRDNARVVRNSTASSFGLTECGVEYLSIGMAQCVGVGGWDEDHHNIGSSNGWHAHASFAITVTRARDCWIRSVKSYRPAGNSLDTHLLSNGIGVSDSSRMTITDCHFQRPQYGGGNGNGYMFRLTNSAEVLVQDCTATVSRHGFVVSGMRSSGNVFLRCADTSTGKQIGGGSTPQNTSGAGNDHHMHFSHCNLVDACTVNNSFFTAHYRDFGGVAGHKITAAHSAFWNTRGEGTSWGAEGVRTEQSRYGYAIGTSGPRSGVGLPTGGGEKMTPEDIVEGVGLGETLDPPSLYEEQLKRRRLQ